MKVSTNLIISKIVLISMWLMFFTIGYSQSKNLGNPNSSGIGINLDKVELVFRDVNVTEHMPSGNNYGYTLRIPRVKINNGEPKDYIGSEMLMVFKNCPQAKKEVNLYLENKKYAKIYSFGSLFLGGSLLFGGVLVTAALDESGHKRPGIALGTGLGLGIGTLVYGLVKAKNYRIKRDEHLRSSVEKYNKRCYSPIIETQNKIISLDSLASSCQSKTVEKNTDIESDKRVKYQLHRNDPAGLRYWNLGITPIDFEVSGNRGFNMFFNANLDVQVSSKIGFNVGLKRAFVDNFTENTFKNKYLDFVNAKFPSIEYKPALRSGLTIAYELKSKNREVITGTRLGYEKMDGRNVEVVGSFKTIERLSYVLRVGHSFENAIYFSPDRLPIGSTTADVTYPHNLFGIIPVPISEIGYAMPMVKSNCFTIGIGRKRIFDYKIEILNSKKFKGKRNSFGYSEWYADLMYGYKLKSGDVVFQYLINSFNDDSGVTSAIKTDITEFSKLGFKGGINIVSNGLSMGVEIGMRPGISTNRVNFGANCVYRFGSRF